MKQHWEITEKEFEAIEEAITNVLHLWQYEVVEARDYDESSCGMNKKVFFDSLKIEFIIK